MLQKDVKITVERREEEEVKKGGKGSRGTMSLGKYSQVLKHIMIQSKVRNKFRSSVKCKTIRCVLTGPSAVISTHSLL